MNAFLRYLILNRTLFQLSSYSHHVNGYIFPQLSAAVVTHNLRLLVDWTSIYPSTICLRPAYTPRHRSEPVY